MHKINHDAMLVEGDVLSYEGPQGRATVETGEEPEAHGLSGKDVLLAAGGSIQQWSYGRGLRNVLSCPRDEPLDNLTGDEFTGLLAFSVGNELMVGKTRSAAAVRTLARFTSDIEAVAIAPAAPLVAASVGSRVEVFRIASCRPILVFSTEAVVRALSFAPGGSGLAAITEDDRLIVWCNETGAILEYSAPNDVVDLALHRTDPGRVDVLSASGERSPREFAKAA